MTIPVGTGRGCQSGFSDSIDITPLPTISVMMTEELMNKRGLLAYVFGSTLVEQQRLLEQAREFQQQPTGPDWLTTRLGVIDVGCGPLGILDSLSQRVGERGDVARLEYGSGSRRLHIVRLGLTNARMIQANALTSGLDKNSLDFAHERLVRSTGRIHKRYCPKWSRWCARTVSSRWSKSTIHHGFVTHRTRRELGGSIFSHCLPRCTTRSSRLSCWLRMNLRRTRRLPTAVRGGFSGLLEGERHAGDPGAFRGAAQSGGGGVETELVHPPAV
jgi:hypothetical protein